VALKHLNNFRSHIGLALAEIICISAFAIEIHRALSGNELSWAYVFEWPLFAGYAVYMWHKLINDDDNDETSPVHEASLEPKSDEALATYNDYLRSVHAKSPEKPREY